VIIRKVKLKLKKKKDAEQIIKLNKEKEIEPIMKMKNEAIKEKNIQKMKRKREEKKEQEREEIHQLVIQRLRAPPLLKLKKARRSRINTR
jgi:hypothetical protein